MAKHTDTNKLHPLFVITIHHHVYNDLTWSEYWLSTTHSLTCIRISAQFCRAKAQHLSKFAETIQSFFLSWKTTLLALGKETASAISAIFKTKLALDLILWFIKCYKQTRANKLLNETKAKQWPNSWVMKQKQKQLNAWKAVVTWLFLGPCALLTFFASTFISFT